MDVRGVVDATQMAQVFEQWGGNPRSRWKVPIVASILEHAEFSGKPSTPYTPESVHDYMHAKVTVADDVVFAGSFNLSRSGELNAENVLELHDPELAERLAAFIDAIRGRYPRMAGVRCRCCASWTTRSTSCGSSVTTNRSMSSGEILPSPSIRSRSQSASPSQ